MYEISDTTNIKSIPLVTMKRMIVDSLTKLSQRIILHIYGSDDIFHTPTACIGIDPNEYLIIWFRPPLRRGRVYLAHLYACSSLQTYSSLIIKSYQISVVLCGMSVSLIDRFADLNFCFI